MSSGAGSGNLPHCHHCGRAVAETVHTRSSYRVDYYALHTGEVEPMTLPRTDEAAPLVTFLKLLRASEVITCAECYRQPRVRHERDMLFRPELCGVLCEEAP